MHLKDMLGGIQANPDIVIGVAPLAGLFQHHGLAHSMPSGAVHPNREAGISTVALAPAFAGLTD
jgi:hypothetical protein